MNKKILIMTSVEAEQQAVLRGLGNVQNIDVVVGGVGIASAAARTAIALSKKEYDLVISAGIGGGFPSRAEVGSLVIASDIICADLGAESPDGFISIDKLGFGTNNFTVVPELVQLTSSYLKASQIIVGVGTILTVSTVTGSHERATELVKLFPEATVEAMEGYGVATAAREYDIPFMEIRTISNEVGPRDRAGWRIKEALETLELAFARLKEVF